jgi:hypothetical protein
MLSRIETAAPKVVRGGGREDNYRCASSTPRRRGSQAQSRRYLAMGAFDEIFGARAATPSMPILNLAASRGCASYAIAMNGSSWPIASIAAATLGGA